jgi:archaellum component FlaC
MANAKQQLAQELEKSIENSQKMIEIFEKLENPPARLSERLDEVRQRIAEGKEALNRLKND